MLLSTPAKDKLLTAHPVQVVISGTKHAYRKSKLSSVTRIPRKYLPLRMEMPEITAALFKVDGNEDDAGALRNARRKLFLPLLLTGHYTQTLCQQDEKFGLEFTPPGTNRTNTGFACAAKLSLNLPQTFPELATNG